MADRLTERQHLVSSTGDTRRVTHLDVGVFLDKKSAEAYKAMLEETGKFKDLEVEYRQGIPMFNVQHDKQLKGDKSYAFEAEKWLEDYTRESRPQLERSEERAVRAVEGEIGAGVRLIGTGRSEETARRKRNLSVEQQKHIDNCESMFLSFGVPGKNIIYMEIDRSEGERYVSAANMVMRNPETGRMENYYLVDINGKYQSVVSVYHELAEGMMRNGAVRDELEQAFYKNMKPEEKRFLDGLSEKERSKELKEYIADYIGQLADMQLHRGAREGLVLPGLRGFLTDVGRIEGKVDVHARDYFRNQGALDQLVIKHMSRFQSEGQKALDEHFKLKRVEGQRDPLEHTEKLNVERQLNKLADRLNKNESRLGSYFNASDKRRFILEQLEKMEAKAPENIKNTLRDMGNKSINSMNFKEATSLIKATEWVLDHMLKGDTPFDSLKSQIKNSYTERFGSEKDAESNLNRDMHWMYPKHKSIDNLKYEELQKIKVRIEKENKKIDDLRFYDRFGVSRKQYGRPYLKNIKEGYSRAKEQSFYNIVQKLKHPRKGRKKVCTKVCQLCRIANDVLFDASLCGVLLYKEHMFALGAQTDVAAHTTAFSR